MGGKPSKKADPQAGVIIQQNSETQPSVPTGPKSSVRVLIINGRRVRIKKPQGLRQCAGKDKKAVIPLPPRSPGSTGPAKVVEAVVYTPPFDAHDLDVSETAIAASPSQSSTLDSEENSYENAHTVVASPIPNSTTRSSSVKTHVDTPNPRAPKMTDSLSGNKWKSALSDVEEDFMDAILEETGAILSNCDKVQIGLDEEFQHLGSSQNTCQGLPVCCC